MGGWDGTGLKETQGSSMDGNTAIFRYLKNEMKFTKTHLKK